MSEAFTLYKLIVLYILDKLDFPLTNGQISEFILDEGYTTYFTLQQAIHEMVDASLIREEISHNRTLYYLTEEGAEVINFFRNHISPAIQQDINNYIAEKNYDLKKEVSAKADYYRNTNGEWAVRFQIIEQGAPLIDLTLTAPSEEEATRMINNWNRSNQEIYATLMQKLLF